MYFEKYLKYFKKVFNIFAILLKILSKYFSDSWWIFDLTKYNYKF